MKRKSLYDKAKERQQKHMGIKKFRSKSLPLILVEDPKITVIKKYGRFNRIAMANGWLKHPPPNSHPYPFEIYDATSGGVMRELSPMVLGPVVDEFGDVLGCNIEDCWQGLKVWDFHMNGGKFNPKKPNLWEDGDEDHWCEEDEWIPEWTKWSQHILWSGEAKRHRVKIDHTLDNPNVPLFSFYRGKRLPYEDARQAMYCRWYDVLVRETEAYKYLKGRFEAGVSIAFLDTDGQPRDTFPPIPITKDMAGKRIVDKDAVFGHGYVLACSIQGFDPWNEYKI